MGVLVEVDGCNVDEGIADVDGLREILVSSIVALGSPTEFRLQLLMPIVLLLVDSSSIAVWFCKGDDAFNATGIPAKVCEKVLVVSVVNSRGLGAALGVNLVDVEGAVLELSDLIISSIEQNSLYLEQSCTFLSLLT
jgi:hypothetical protein